MLLIISPCTVGEFTTDFIRMRENPITWENDRANSAAYICWTLTRPIHFDSGGLKMLFMGQTLELFSD